MPVKRFDDLMVIQFSPPLVPAGLSARYSTRVTIQLPVRILRRIRNFHGTVFDYESIPRSIYLIYKDNIGKMTKNHKLT